MAARVPIPTEGAGEDKRVFEVSGGTTVGQSRSEIAVFLTDPRVGSGFRRAGAGNLDGPRAVGVVHGMAGPYRDRVVVPLELLDPAIPSVLAVRRIRFLSSSEPRPPRMSGSGAAQICSAAESVQPPAKTDNRLKSVRSRCARRS